MRGLDYQEKLQKPKNHTTRNSSIRRRDQTAEIEDRNKKRFPYNGVGYTKMFTSSHQPKISNQQLPRQILLDLGRRGRNYSKQNQARTQKEPSCALYISVTTLNHQIRAAKIHQLNLTKKT